jgi:HlyD family secretion protein
MKVWIILLVLAGAGGWWYINNSHSVAIQYETGVVGRGDLTQVVTATGILNPVINVQVGSQISGNIAKLFADWNSSVKAGQIVAQIDEAPYLAVVHQCQGDLASSKAALELAQIIAKRKQELLAEHAAPQADLDTAIANLHQAEATVVMKEANLEAAKVNLDHCTISSPIDGTVISRAVDVGQTVAAALNAPVIFTIAKDLRKMQIDSAVAEADVGVAAVGQDVDFTVDAFPYRIFHGKVAQVRFFPSTVQNVVTYDVVISVANDDLKLMPGMTATVSLIVSQRENVLKIPNSALRFRPVEPIAAAGAPSLVAGGGRGHKSALKERNIYVLGPDQKSPWPVEVKLGITDGIATEVLTGLQEGDKVVTGVTQPASSSASGPKPNNPLSGSSRR